VDVVAVAGGGSNERDPDDSKATEDPGPLGGRAGVGRRHSGWGSWLSLC